MKKILLPLLALLSTLPAKADDPRSLSVRGEGELKIKPDIAIVSLNVQTKGKDAKSAQSKNANEMARVQGVLKSAFKIDPKHIQTSGYSVNPDYRYENNGKQVFLGYSVSHGLIVTLHKLEQAGELMDKLVGKGTEDVAVLLSGIQFDTDKRKEYEVQALELAMKNAESRAQTLAKFARRGLKGVRRISDSNVSYRLFDQRGGGAMMMAAKAEMESQSTQISGGEITVNSSVAVDYEME